MSDPKGASDCASCGRLLGVRAFVSLGYLGTYVECEWCFTGTTRPEEPELITDTFTPPAEPELQSLDRIVDKPTGTSGEHADRAYADERERLDAAFRVAR